MDNYRGELFTKEYLPRVKAFPKVRELFERNMQDHKQIALASSSKPDELKAYKKIANIDDLIQGEMSSGNVEKSKPYPDIFEAALEQLGNPAVDKVIVVGDTPYDAEAADKANLNTIGLLCGGWTEEQLSRGGCIAIYRDPADLLTHYEESPLRDPTQFGRNSPTRRGFEDLVWHANRRYFRQGTLERVQSTSAKTVIMYDVVVVGAGSAGLSAALLLGRRLRKN